MRSCRIGTPQASGPRLLEGLRLGRAWQSAARPSSPTGRSSTKSQLDYKLLNIGLDFGYTNDPTAIVKVYTDGHGFILDEVCYATGL